LVAHRTTADEARLIKVRTDENLKEIIFATKKKSTVEFNQQCRVEIKT
jgi:hypothetical protein